MSESISEQLDKKSAGYLARILAASEKMSNLIDNILTYSKTTANADALQPVDLNAVVEEIVTGVQDEHHPDDIHITADPLPVVKGIAFQLAQLFDNLIHNSIKYRRDDQPCEIEIKYQLVDNEFDEGATHPSQKFHKISVIDNGQGFDPQYSKKIFEIFQRLDNAPGKSGAGIGLAICRRIVQNHNGIIEATGEVSKGARFDIYLPSGDS